MNKNEAKEILATRVADLRSRPYSEISNLMARGERVEDIRGASGATYCMATQARWDDRSRKAIRVLVSIHDGGLRAFVPLTDDFIISPDVSEGTSDPIA